MNLDWVFSNIIELLLSGKGDKYLYFIVINTKTLGNEVFTIPIIYFEIAKKKSKYGKILTSVKSRR